MQIPSPELGAVHDGGAADTGAGLEAGGGLRYADPSSGVSMNLGARTPLAHAGSGCRKWKAKPVPVGLKYLVI